MSARLRHIVLATSSLAAAVAAQAGLELGPGSSDAAGMLAFDAEHEVLRAWLSAEGRAWLSAERPSGKREETRP